MRSVLSDRLRVRDKVFGEHLRGADVQSAARVRFSEEGPGRTAPIDRAGDRRADGQLRARAGLHRRRMLSPAASSSARVTLTARLGLHARRRQPRADRRSARSRSWTPAFRCRAVRTPVAAGHQHHGLLHLVHEPHAYDLRLSDSMALPANRLHANAGLHSWARVRRSPARARRRNACRCAVSATTASTIVPAQTAGSCHAVLRDSAGPSIQPDLRVLLLTDGDRAKLGAHGVAGRGRRDAAGGRRLLQSEDRRRWSLCADGGVCPEGFTLRRDGRAGRRPDEVPAGDASHRTDVLARSGDRVRSVCQSGCECGRCTLTSKALTCVPPGAKKRGDVCTRARTTARPGTCA